MHASEGAVHLHQDWTVKYGYLSDNELAMRVFVPSRRHCKHTHLCDEIVAFRNIGAPTRAAQHRSKPTGHAQLAVGSEDAGPSGFLLNSSRDGSNATSLPCNEEPRYVATKEPNPRPPECRINLLPNPLNSQSGAGQSTHLKKSILCKDRTTRRQHVYLVFHTY
jgi:hypothetical protein